MDWIVLPRPISSAKMQFRLRAEKKEKKKKCKCTSKNTIFHAAAAIHDIPAFK